MRSWVALVALLSANAVSAQQVSPYRFSCPTAGVSTTIPSSSILSAISSPGYISIDSTSSQGSLCILTLRDNSGETTADLPIARSYDGLDWEVTAGFLSNSLPSPVCSSSVCNMMGLPAPSSDEKTYVLTSYSHNGFGSQADSARFLEQATFGPTRETIIALEAMGTGKYKSWVQNQIENVPMSSHREYFRRHLNPRQEYPYYVSAPGPATACEAETHWRMFALSERDGIRNSQTQVAKYLSIKLVNGRYVWYVEGMARTTTDVLPNLMTGDDQVIEQLELYPTLYLLHYRTPERKMCVGCPVRVLKSTGGDGYIYNPKVDLTGIVNDSSQVPRTIVNLPPILGSGTAMIPVNQEKFETSAFFSKYYKEDDEFYLQDASSVNPSQCANHPNLHTAGATTPTELPHTHVAASNHPETVFPPIFGKVFNEQSGQYEHVLYDPKMKIFDNTVDDPIDDGGGYLEYVTQGKYNCANAPRSFLNEGGCKLSFSEYACKTGSDAVISSPQNPTQDGVVVCGSVGEIKNDYSLGTANSYDLKTESSKQYNVDIYLFGTFMEYKYTVWANQALFDEGQLRQRMAWALYQIIPIGTPDTTAGPGAEVWFQYYDTFVRHAFGNYKNILKEISYTDVMGKWLSFYDNQSLQYNIDNCDLGANTIEQCETTHPDENYAREIMQLFSIGVWQLNMDGTKKLDENGQPLHSYDSSDIMNIARAWTGFSRAYRNRGNAESGKWGPHLDPMHIERLYRDIYPKADLLGGYIGDRYPLCADLPVKDHLMKGATYRLNGASSNSEMQQLDWWTWPDNEHVPKLVLQDSSPLYEKLCAADGSGSCTWPGKVVLQEHLTYTDTTLDEFKVDTIRTVRIVLPNGKLVHYEYIRPACVDQFFLGTNAKKVIRGNIGSDLWHDESLCADPKRDIATELCCDPDWESNTSSQYASRHCIYQAERMSYDFASSRCAEFGKVQCTPRRYGATSCSIDINRGLWYSWTASGCMTRAKISFDLGLIGRVDYPEPDFAGQRLVSKVVQDNTKNFFKVAWDAEPNLPSTAADCDALSNCYSVSDGCVCDTSLSEIAVFGSSSDISSKDDLFPALHVGTFGPDSFDAGVVIALGDCGIPDVNVYSRSSSDSCSNLSNDAFFGFTDHHGIQRYLKNMRSIVEILGVGASFRNVPYFISLTDHDTRDMYYETDAVVEHFFHHPSHAPFLSSLIIQRFGISNPSPGYVERVATAYVNGVYDGIGSGEYGDLGAMIAAVLLDKESRSTTLDADPSHGHLREPLIKVTSLLRSMDTVHDSPDSWPRFHRLDIGQAPYESPSVFSFFLPEYSPAGVIEKAKLVAPESQVMTGKQVTSLLDGLFTTVKFGLVSCYNGFSKTASITGCPAEEGNTVASAGYLDYSFPSGASVEEAIDDLALLLTAGRLSSTNRAIIRDTISEEYSTGDKAKATRIAQQLVLSSPEFHSWGGLHDNTGEARNIKGYTWPPKNDHKSVVFFFMDGGADSWNMVVPKSGCSSKDMYNEYKNARGKLAIHTDLLLDIDATGSGHVCNTWGVHHKLPILKELYDQGDAMFFLNTGILSEPMTKADDWVTKSKIRLFAHNHMSREMLALDPHDVNPGTGVGGRMLDMLKKNGFQTSGNTVNGNSLLNAGDSYYSNPATTISSGGISKIDEVSTLSNNEMLDLVKQINGKSNAGNSMLGETWSDRLSRSLFEYETALSIDEAIQNGDFNMNGYPASTRIDYDLKAVAEFMKSRHLRKVDREVYEVNQGGFDMHSDHLALDYKFDEANYALKNFINELKNQGTWDNTVILMGSDFGRSVAPNSNGGSDHAWGGHYFMLGGGLKGGKIMGEYPEHLSEMSPYWVRRGRMIPTTPWDSIWNGIAEWMGVKGDRDLDFVLPNRVNFDKCSKMFTAHDLFEGEVNEPCIDDLDGDGVPDAQDTCQDTMYWMNVPVDSSGCTGPVTMWPTPKEPSSPSLNPSAAPVTPPSDSPSLNPSAASVTDTSDSPSLNPSAASVTDTSDSPSLNPSAASVTDISDSPSLNPSAAPVSNPGTGPSGPWFIDPAGITLNTDNEKPRIEVNHNVASGAGGLEVTLYQYDCITPVPANDAVYVVDSLTNLGDDDVAEYVIEFDKETIGSSDLLVGSDELNFCVVAGLEDTASGEILVYSLSRIKLTFDLSYALFFVDVTGVAPNDYDLGEISLFQMNACVCSVSFTCDANPPLLQENTLLSVCLWPSSPGVMFTDFTMDIEGKTNGYSYSPITVADGAQVLDDYTVLQQQNDMWMVTTMLLPGLFENESSMAVISGGGYLEFITSKDEVLKEEKEYTLVVALEEPEEGNPIDCLLDQLGKVMKTEILSSPIKIVGEKMGNLTVSGNLRKRSDND